MVVKPAGLVSGRGIVVHFAAVARAIILPPTDALDELAADFRRRGAARQQMLGAVDLRRLRKDRRAAVAHQDVGRSAKRRIGGDPRIAVRTAALKRERQLARRRRRSLGRGRATAASRGRAPRRPRPSCACPRSPGSSGSGTSRSRRPRILPSCGRSETLRSQARPSRSRQCWDLRRSPIACASARRNPRPWRRCRSRCRARAR